MFGKIVNGKMIPAPNVLTHDGKCCINPSAGTLISAGYVPLRFTVCPAAGCVERWELVDGVGVQCWDESPAAEPTEIEALTASIEALQAENALLMECLLEMSEIVYA